MKNYILSFLLTFVGLNGVFGQITWQGTTGDPGSNWFITGNWDPARIPIVSDSVIIPFIEVGADPIIDTGSAVCASISITEGAATLTISSDGDITVGGNLRFAGAIANAGVINIEGDLINNTGGVSTITGTTIFAGGSGSEITTDSVIFSGTVTNTHGLSSSEVVSIATFNNNNLADFDGDFTLSTALTNTDTIRVSNAFNVTSSMALDGVIEYDGAGGVQVVDEDITSFDNLTNDNTVGLNRPAGILTISGVFDNNGTFDCDQNLTITGTIDNTAGNLNFSAATLSTSDLTIEGSVLFNGTTTSITDAIQFTNVSITGTLTAPSSILVSGIFDDDGTFTHSSGTVTFNGGAGQSLPGSSNTAFNNVTVTGASTAVSVPGIPTITGSLTLDNATSSIAFTNTYDLTANPAAFSNLGTITFSGGISNEDDITKNFDDDSGTTELAGTYDMGTSTNHSFYDLTLLALANYATVGEVTVNGVFDTETNSATFTLKDGGSLLQADGASNTAATINVQRLGNNSKLEYTYWSSPVDGTVNPGAVFATTAWYDIYYYDLDNVISTDSMEGWARPGNLGDPFVVGRGYVATVDENFDDVPASNTEETYVFTGEPNSGTLNVGTIATNSNLSNSFNLVGNPYPSAIEVQKLYDANSSIIPNGVYIYDADGAGEEDDEYIFRFGGNTIASCQSFMVQAIEPGGTLSFTNAMRQSTNTNFLRMAPDYGEIYLMATNVSGFDKPTYFNFNPESTPGYDASWDPAYINSRKHVEFYSTIEGTPGQFVMQGLGALDTIKRIPLGLDIYDDLEVEIKIDTIIKLDSTIRVFLVDLDLAVSHDLRNDGPYTAFFDSLGIYPNRFELFVFPSTIGLSEYHGNSNPETVDFVSYQTGDGLFLGGFDDEMIDQVRLIDINGRLIQYWELKNVQKEYQLSFHQLVDGMYFVQVITKAGKSGVQKMILH
jgi:hypothetical protein